MVWAIETLRVGGEIRAVAADSRPGQGTLSFSIPRDEKYICFTFFTLLSPSL